MAVGAPSIDFVGSHKCVATSACNVEGLRAPVADHRRELTMLARARCNVEQRNLKDPAAHFTYEFLRRSRKKYTSASAVRHTGPIKNAKPKALPRRAYTTQDRIERMVKVVVQRYDAIWRDITVGYCGQNAP